MNKVIIQTTLGLNLLCFIAGFQFVSLLSGELCMLKRKRTARTVLTGTGYSVGRVIRQGNSSLT
ncbi:hypothetical protein [Citrobacter freundii]|uniref:hypothetical protein n=1 Tax=Citrobacter freundii TaxID=546 RepID=UPI003AAEF97E